MRIQVLIPLIIGLSACGIGSAYIYYQIKEQTEADKKTKRKGGASDDDHPLTSVDVITCAELAIHNEFVPVILGKDGLNLKALETKTRTKITFRKEGRQNDDHQTCVIEGTLDAIEDARKIILMIASKPVLVTEELDVSPSACGKILGRCGEMLQEICRKSNAKVSVNSSEVNQQRQVVITGTRSQVKAARSLIEEKIQEDTELRKAIEESELKRERRGPLKSSSGLSDSQSSLPESVLSSTTATSARAGALTTGQMEVYVSAIASPSKFWLQMVGPQSTELDTLIEEMSEYYDRVENQEVHQIEEPCLDQIVASQFKWDNKWYRARVVAILPNEFNEEGMVLDIYFLDYGDSAYVAPHEVFQLRADFLTLRFQAIECFLANVAPLDFREQEALKREEQRADAGGDQEQERDVEEIHAQQRFKWDRRAVERFEQLTHVAQWELLLCRVVCHEKRKRSGRKEQQQQRGVLMGREGSPVPGVELYDVAQGVDVNVGQQMIVDGLAVPTVYQKGGGGVGGGFRTTMMGGSTNGSQQSSRTMSPVGFGASLQLPALNGKGGGAGGNCSQQVAICENSSNENFENANYESRQQQMRQ